MSISAPRPPSSVATDTEDGATLLSAHEASERRVFPGWRWMAVWPALPVAGLVGWVIGGRGVGAGGALLFTLLSGLLIARVPPPRARAA